MPGAEINITGLRELRSALRKIDKGLQVELREELKGAVNIVVRDVQGHVPHNTGRAAASVRSTASGDTIYLKAGGARVPYWGWLDFGGRLPDKSVSGANAMDGGSLMHPVKRVRGGRRAKLRDGRYIYPAIRRQTPKLVDAAGDAVDKAARKAGFH
jgi:hypothetical protein